MKRKELEAMGLEKEQVDQIMTQNTDYGKRGTAGTVEYRK